MTEFILQGLAFSLFLTFLIFFIIIIKILLGEKLTAKVHYHLWFSLFAASAASLLPRFSLPFEHLPSGPVVSSNMSTAQNSSGMLLHDFAAETTTTWHTIAPILFVIWLSGIVIMMSRIFLGIWGIRTLYRSSQPIHPGELSQCCQLLHIKPAKKSQLLFLSRFLLFIASQTGRRRRP